MGASLGDGSRFDVGERQLPHLNLCTYSLGQDHHPPTHVARDVSCPRDVPLSPHATFPSPLDQRHDIPASPLSAPLPSAATAVQFLVPDVEDIQRAVLLDSAERAKRRRQQEEEDREKAQERARKKVADFEAKMAKASAEKDDARESEPKAATVSETISSHPSEVRIITCDCIVNMSLSCCSY